MPEPTGEPDRDVLRQKIQFVRDTLRMLRELREEPREEFLEDWKSQAAATRSLQVGIEAILDAAHHIIAREGLGLPKTYQDAIEILVRERVLPRDTREQFTKMTPQDLPRPPSERPHGTSERGRRVASKSRAWTESFCIVI